MSYISFENYLEKTKYNEIFGSVLHFYNSVKEHYDLHTYAVPYPSFIKLDEITVEKAYFKDDIFEKTSELKLAVRADFILKGDRTNDFESDSNSRKFLVTCNAVVDANGIHHFRITDVDEYITQPYAYKQGLSEFAIPYISAEDLDAKAELFLKKHCKEALDMPMALPIQQILDNMGVRAYHAPLDKNVLGKALFGSSVEKVYNDDNEIIEAEIGARSILIDPDVCFLRNIGSYNNTVIHECIHIEFHSKYFELQKIIDKSSNSIICRVGKGNGNSTSKEHKAYNFMEWQATMLAPRILMPARMTTMKYHQFMDEVGSNYPNLSIANRLDIVIEKLADFFNVSKQAAKIRLIDLGYDKASGIQNYINGRKVPNFTFSGESINRNQTFVIDFVDSILQIRNNEKLSKLSREGKITYVDGFVVINSQKFVTIAENGKKELTTYALGHIDECAFAFTKRQADSNNVYNNYLDSIYFLCRPENKSDYVQAEFDNDSPHNKKLQKYADELVETRDAKELLKRMNGEFFEDLNVVVEEMGYTKSDGSPNYYQIAQLTQVSDHTIKSYLDGTSKPQKEKLLAICGGLGLHARVAYKLLEKANISIMGSLDETDLIYCGLIERHNDEGLDQWNKYLHEAKKNQLP